MKTLCSCGAVFEVLAEFRLCLTCDAVADKPGRDPVVATWIDRLNPDS